MGSLVVTEMGDVDSETGAQSAQNTTASGGQRGLEVEEGDEGKDAGDQEMLCSRFWKMHAKASLLVLATSPSLALTTSPHTFQVHWPPKPKECHKC